MSEGRAKVLTYSVEPIAEGIYKICDRCDKHLAPGDNSYLCHLTRSTFCSVECLEQKPVIKIKLDNGWNIFLDSKPEVSKNVLVKVAEKGTMFFAGKVFAGSTGRIVVYCEALRATKALENNMNWKYLD